jgi:mannose-6-phosphate isomerase-like protein (cupin superfamily)
MQKHQLRLRSPFHVVCDAHGAQVAEMTIAPGKSEGGPKNNHRRADQWLYVVAGAGSATVEGRRVKLKAGSLVVIERGENHEIRNTGTTPLRTVNFYTPPAFKTDGDPRLRGRPRGELVDKVRERVRSTVVGRGVARVGDAVRRVAGGRRSAGR